MALEHDVHVLDLHGHVFRFAVGTLVLPLQQQIFPDLIALEFTLLILHS